MGELYFYLVQECRSPPGALVLCDAYLFACIYIYMLPLSWSSRGILVSRFCELLLLLSAVGLSKKWDKPTAATRTRFARIIN